MDVANLTADAWVKLFQNAPPEIKTMMGIKTARTYNPDEEWVKDYFFWNFYNEFVNGQQFYGSDHETKVKDKLIPALLRVIRIIETGNNRKIIIKVGYADPNNPQGDWVVIVDFNAFKTQYSVSNGCFYTISHNSTKGGKVGDEKIWMFQEILTNPLFRFRQMDWVPRKESEISVVHKDIFNMFTGFRAKFNGNTDPTRIQLILQHIYLVWSNRDEQVYFWILSWLASLVQFPRKKLPLLFLFGGQGTGKTILIEFLLKRVFGHSNTATLNNLDEALGQYNSIIANKFLVYVSETEGTEHQNGKIYTKMNKLKSLVTDDRIMIHTKYVNAYELSNHTHWICSSNSLDSMRIEVDDRRIAAFTVSNEYKGNSKYFSALSDSLTDEAANNFYSYLMQITISIDFGKVIETEARQDLKDMSLASAVRFYKEFTSSKWLPRSFRYEIKYKPEKANNKYCRITKQELFDIYIQWCYESKINPDPKNWFFKRLKDSGTDKTKKSHGDEFWIIETKLIDGVLSISKKNNVLLLLKDAQDINDKSNVLSYP